MRRATWAVLIASLAFFSVFANDNDEKEVEAIRAVIESAYVEGVHINRDADAMEKGFHPVFKMLVMRDGEIRVVPIEEWVNNVRKGYSRNPEPRKGVTYNLAMVDVTGHAAVAKIELHRDSKHVFTDYMSLYKGPEGWKIVGKIFQSHR